MKELLITKTSNNRSPHQAIEKNMEGNDSKKNSYAAISKSLKETLFFYQLVLSFFLKLFEGGERIF